MTSNSKYQINSNNSNSKNQTGLNGNCRDLMVKDLRPMEVAGLRSEAGFEGEMGKSELGRRKGEEARGSKLKKRLAASRFKVEVEVKKPLASNLQHKAKRSYNGRRLSQRS